MEKLRAQAQFQLAIHPLALLGYSAQKIVNRLLRESAEERLTHYRKLTPL
jgi:hypothetical protein